MGDKNEASVAAGGRTSQGLSPDISQLRIQTESEHVGQNARQPNLVVSGWASECPEFCEL